MNTEETLFSSFGYDNTVLIVLDTETTGLNLEEDRMIEFSAICVNPITREQRAFSRLLCQDKDLDEFVVKLTGITKELLCEEGITEEHFAKEFEAFLSQCGDAHIILVAYHAQFDLCFLKALLNRVENQTGIAYSSCLDTVDWIDALTIYRDRSEKPHKLKDAIVHYHLENEVVNAHRAMEDAKALLAVLHAMDFERADFANYLNVFGYNHRYGVAYTRMDGIRYVPQRDRIRKGMAKPEKILPKKVSIN